MFFNKKKKVFCIGRNKTGTTSIEQALKLFGYKMGDQASGELLMRDWAKRDFKKIIKLCKTADAFQDAPFSYDFTFQAMDEAFPESKFILTTRSSGEEWFESVIRFQTKIIAKNRLPTVQDLKEFPYRYKGWLWENSQRVYGINEETLYDKNIYINHYNKHNDRVLEYFRNRPNDLLVLNISDSSAMEKLCDFLGIKFTGQTMPHLNQSK